MGGSDWGNTVEDQRWSTREDLQQVTDTLIAEFAGQLPAGTVMRGVAQAREQLLRSGVRSGLAVAAEAMARLRLSQSLRAP